MDVKIQPIDVHTFADSVRMVMLFMKEHKGMLIHRIEAENILKNPLNRTYVLVVNHEVRGIYVYEDGENIYTVKVFILDPLVRQKKAGYLLWKQMKIKLQDKPAIIGVIEGNKKIQSIVSKRGKYIGTYLDEEGETVEYYNLSFRDEE